MAAPDFYLCCDSCHHQVPYFGPMARKHVGTPCPVCGENMLTKADYRVALPVSWLFRALRRLGLARPHDPDNSVHFGEKIVEVDVPRRDRL